MKDKDWKRQERRDALGIVLFESALVLWAIGSACDWSWPRFWPAIKEVLLLLGLAWICFSIGLDLIDPAWPPRTGNRWTQAFVGALAVAAFAFFGSLLRQGTI